MNKKQIVTADGKHVIHDGALFKRTVLPSAAAPSKDTLEVIDALDDLNSGGPREN